MGSAINLSDIATKIPPEDARFQQESVADLLGRKSLGFPGAQPVSFARSHLQELQRVDYWLCEKTDGIRCLLYLTQYIAEGGQPVEMQFLIDRKNDYYFIPTDTLHIPPEGDNIGAFHTGTLLDGELVLQKTCTGDKRLAYLIFDMLALDSENITTRPFDKRLYRAETIFYNPYRKFANKFPTDAASQPFDIQLKKMELPYGTEMMFKDKIPKLPHGNDGLIFTCVTTPYVAGTDQHILKWKPPQENTIDFRFQIDSFPTEQYDDGEYEDWDAKPEIALLVNHGGGADQYFAMLTLTDAEWAALKRMNQVLDGRIIECYRDPVTTQWRPKVEEDGTPRFRDDKTSANHISTVNSVLESIKDAVSEQDLIESAGRIRAAFKQREAEKRAGAAAAEQRMREAAKAQQQQQQQHRHQQGPPMQQQRVKQEVDEDDGPKYED